MCIFEANEHNTHPEHEIEVKEVAPWGLEKANPSQFELLKVSFICLVI